MANYLLIGALLWLCLFTAPTPTHSLTMSPSIRGACGKLPHTHWCIANKEIYMLTFLDKHNNYFTLMMLIMGLPVKVSCRLECDLSLMSSIMRRQANIGQNLCHFHAFMRIVCAHIFVYRGSKLPFWKPSTIRQRRLQMRKPSAKSKVHVSQTHV